MKIIVVEDEPKSREGILNILARDTEYEVAAVCGNGKEGLEAVRKYRPDLVISDIKMPVMGGLEMLEKILEEGIAVQAVLLTGYSEFEYARRALKLQVVEYVLKPLEVDDFLEVLHKAEGCCVTPEYLSRIFCRETGVNFTSFLQNFRVSTAKRLLLSGNYKVYEVAEMVGFHDQ